MALKPTIYKFEVALADLDRQIYDDFGLTVALHPSETTARMMARVMAHCMNAGAGLEFGKGISDSDEPDLWSHTLDGQIVTWIEVGEPAPKRIKQASRLAQRVLVYAFNGKADVWWSKCGREISGHGAEVIAFDPAGILALADLVERTLRISLTISGQSALIATDDASVEVVWQRLEAPG